jgi:parallel beta-helix repeat protein
VAGGQRQQNAAAHGPCAAGKACTYADDVFFDDRPLRRVLRIEAVGPGTFFFDYAHDQIWIGADPHGHRVEAAVTTRAFKGWGSGADKVQISSLRIEKFANEAQSGAINGRPTWVVVHCDVRLNHGIGIQDAGVIVGNHVHDNGQLGVGGSLIKRGLVAHNEIDHNGYARFDPGWEAGGGKWLKTANLVIRDNYVHDNWGPGLWTDTDNVHTTYLRNRVVSNTGPGIDHEASYDARIADNISSQNGRGERGWVDGAGILVNSSRSVTISGNKVTDNADGIGLVQTDRGTGPEGPHLLQDVRATHNTVVMRMGRTGLVNDTGDAALYTTYGNRFDRNTYVLGCTPLPFAWARSEGSGDYAYITRAAWVAAGNDTHSHFELRCAGSGSRP